MRKIFLLGVASIFASLSFAQSVSTLFASDNQFRGNTFDISSSVPIDIVGFDVNIVGGNESITVHYKQGTSVGFEDNAAAWTMLGTDAGVVAQGQDVPTPVAVGGLTIPAGQTFGLYVDLSSYVGTEAGRDGALDDQGRGAAAMLYTNGGPQVFTDGTVSLTSNTGQGDPPFTSIFTPRIWNGTLYYEIANTVPTLSQWALLAFCVLLAASGVVVMARNRRQTI